MANTRVLFASWSPLALVLALPFPSLANEDLRLREYEVKLAAHRRELMQRETDLAAARHEIRALKRRGGVTHVERPSHDPVEGPLPSTQTSSDSEARFEDRTERIIETLRDDLELEREHRSTVEQELQRVLADHRPSPLIEPLRQSLESAKAEVLVLNQRVVEGGEEREALELARERLARELRDANETIVALRARIESLAASSGGAASLQALEQENAGLRAALAAMEQRNADLRVEAELAAQLAEMLYAEPR